MSDVKHESKDPMHQLRDGSRRAMHVIRDESLRAVKASEEAARRTFLEARLRASLAIGLVLVGFLLVAQWRGVRTSVSSLEGQSDQNLAIIISEMTAENSSMRNEILRLETQLLKANSDEAGRSEVLDQAAREIESLRVLAGFEGARGPGIVVTVRDSSGVLLPQDLVNVVQELRAAGAEAMSVNGVRLEATTGFSMQGEHLAAGDMELTQPYRFVAIGDAGNLQQAIELPGGLAAALKAFPEVGVAVEKKDPLDVPPGAAATYTFGKPAHS
jgi:uncharacterized protein YlxW (UPF0749 family)